MEYILITGNTKLLSQEVLDILTRQYRLVVTVGDERAESEGKDKNLQVYHMNPMDEKFQQLFDAWSFRMVVYLSSYADGAEGSFGDMKQLERSLACARTAEVEKFVLVSTADSQDYFRRTARGGQPLEREYQSERAFHAGQSEDMCRYFKKHTEMKMFTLWCPYLAGKVNENNFLGGIFQKLANQEKIVLPGKEEEQVDFLSMTDLARLLWQLAEETEDESLSAYAVSGYRHTWKDFGEGLQAASSGKAQIVYGGGEHRVELPAYPSELRKRYGFIPMDDVIGDLGDYYETYCREVLGGEQGWLRRTRDGAKKLFGKVFKYLELVLVFILIEFLARYSSESVYFKVVDVRLIFIVVMGTFYGMRLGVLSALMECAVLVIKYGQMGMDGAMLFYNVENWIPFAYYLMTGSVCGYLSDKKTDEMKFLRKDMQLLREKYLFMNRIYERVVENRGEYKRQILGFQDSFGKIFSAVQRLDEEMIGNVFLKGLQVIEEILRNHAIAIYTLDSWQRAGRLAVCSNSQLSKRTKTIWMEEFKELYDTVRKGEIYCNVGFQKNMPAYACGIMRDDQVALLILIWEADTEQYSTYYRNLFRILCSLVEVSFLRALDYEELRRGEIYYEHTNIIRPEYLRQNLQIQEDMRMAGISDYVLVQFLSRDRQELSEKLAGMIRVTDILGADEEGRIYLVLTQSKRDNFEVVAQRLKERKIGYQLVEKAGEAG